MPRSRSVPARSQGDAESRSSPNGNLPERAVGGARDSANGQPARARQRAFCVAALPEGDELAELAELLRTAGVGVVGEMIQRRETPHPNTYLGPGKVAEAKAAAQRRRRQSDRLRRRAERPPGAQPRAGDRPARRRPHDRDPRHLRHHAAHAPRASCRSSWPSSNTTSPACAGCGPTSSASAAASARGGPGETQIETDRRLARDRIAALRRRLEHVKGTRARAARRARARVAADDRARRLHQRRQVDAAQCADRRRRRRARPPVPHARSDHPHATPQRAPASGDRHRRLHLASCRTSSSTPSPPRCRRRAAPTCSRT